MMNRIVILQIVLWGGSVLFLSAEPLPIDPLWKSEAFRRTVTASFGIDSRIEPIITVDEEFYLEASAKAMAENNREEAIKVLKESSLLDGSPAMLFNLATLSYESDLKEEAAKLFEKTLTAFPNFRDAHRNLAILLVQEQKLAEAEKHLVRAIELGSREGLTFGLLGYCHASKDHHQAALDAYRQAMLTQPSERSWRLGEAQALQQLGHSREAASVYQSLIDEAPAEISPWLAQADAWVDQENELAAIANLELAHRSKALNASALLSLGHLLAREGLPDLALTRYQDALKSKPGPTLEGVIVGVEQLLAESAWSQAQQLAEGLAASSDLSPALTDSKTDVRLLSRLTRAQALIELEHGDPKTGASLVEKWLARDPLDGPAQILLARFYEDANRREEAEMLLEQAARLPEHAAAAQKAHGRLLVMAGDYDAALEHLEKAYSLEQEESLANYITAVRDLAE